MKRVFTPTKKKTILIVDDDQLVIKAHRDQLQGHGFRVEVASNGESAMERLAQDPVEIVLLDLCLPEVNGIEVLKNIRANFAALPVVVFANPYLTSLARSAQEEGASKCLTKADNTPAQVFELVRTLLAPGQVVVDNSTATIEDGMEPELQQELAAILLIHAPDNLAKLRASHQILARTAEEEPQRAHLREMHRQVRSLTAAGLTGLRRISQMADAFEALLIELHAKPKKITPSVIRTVAQAIDSLASLFEQAKKSQIEAPVSPRILVVDDEVISRETLCSALARARLGAISLDDSLVAQRSLEQEHFDLIFLDVEMPGLNGFELCVKIREMTTNRATPVVFVTAHSDFASRAQSALSGGNDFITKPFLSGELAVKALSCLLRESPRAPSTSVAPTSVPLSMVRHDVQPSLDYPALRLHEGLLLKPDAVV